MVVVCGRHCRIPLGVGACVHDLCSPSDQQSAETDVLLLFGLTQPAGRP